LGFYARTRVWFALLLACMPLLDFAPAQETTSPNPSPVVRGGNPSPEAKSSPQSQEKKEPNGSLVVPAYTITDERNAPALKSKEKFHLFVSGALEDPQADRGASLTLRSSCGQKFTAKSLVRSKVRKTPNSCHEKVGSHQGGCSSLDITVFRADDN